MNPPRVSAIIPTYHDWERLELCVQALEKQTLPRDSYEVIVVNNDPADACPNAMLQHRVRVLAEPRRGSYAARNAAISVARGEILAFTDSDCIPELDWLEQGVKSFDENPEASRIAGAVQLFFAASKPTAAELHEKLFAFQVERYLREGWAVTANMMARRITFEQVGLFDDSLMSGGDKQWGKRAAAKGCSIAYGKMVRVNHPARRTVQELVIKLKRTMRGHSMLGAESHGKLTLLQLFRVLTYWKARSMWKAIRTIVQRENGLSIGQKLRVLAVRFYLEIVGFGETIRLNRRDDFSRPEG